MIHGGPGSCTPDDLPAVDLVAQDRLVIEYDQLDCGRSERVNDPTCWTVDGHIAELHALRRALGLNEVHLHGASWGGMLGLAYVLAHPAGVRSLTLAGAPVSVPRWLAASEAARAALPASTRRALERCERVLLRHPAAPRRSPTAPTSQALRRRAASLERQLPLARRRSVQALARAASRARVFARAVYPILGIEVMDRHVYRGGDVPAGALVGQVGMNPAVYETMWGPSEHLGVGPLASFDLTDRLVEVDIPVLITSGEHELFTPDAAQAAAESLRSCEWELFEGCGHCAGYEDPERYATVLRQFLNRADGREGCAPDVSA